ncbi:MAG TPA: methyltransferase domain-containing protein [Candidatus Eisenbergiella merdigallinarum]|uniref:Methyltransferase domain-containing protein n=1 Tax=Candidatus Eisenbergiella merdigallinarum TaxID=2838552 RepID=A0A9D2MU23_9FIRM|nr:methyltransferase domain-containing protein [Candidatus Eisenbergiella merdigallinarum]
MEAYEDFALVYDTFMDETPYDGWCGRVKKILEEAGIREGLVLDLGCGTGNMTERLARAGYDMIGVDLSARMLDIALKKREKSGLDILYLQQDMREFELYGTVRAVVCLCDSLNYLLEEDELRETFRLVNNYLDPGGLFLFDFNTVYKYETVIGDSTIAENRDDCSFIWENYYDGESGLNEYDLTIFLREEGELFRRFTETHVQRGYTLDAIRRLAEEAGLIWVDALDADTGGRPAEESERIFAVAKERGKDGI